MEIAYQKNINASKLAKVKEVAARLKINPSWLMIVIAKETGGTFSPSVKNPGSSATGLIQFMSKTAEQLGTTTTKLAAMSFVEQMDYVQKYLLMVLRDRKMSGFKSFYDVYFAVFYPAALGRSDNWKFPPSIYNPNRGLDTNRNGEITVGEFKKWASKGHERFLAPSVIQGDLIAPLGASLLLLVVAFFVWK